MQYNNSLPDNMSVPCCLLMKLNEGDQALDIRDRLFGEENIDNEGIWKVDNKYYTCQVRIRVEEKEEEIGEANDVEAVVFYSEVVTASSWSKTEEKMSRVREKLGSERETQMMVAEQFQGEEVKAKAVKWCLENGEIICRFDHLTKSYQFPIFFRIRACRLFRGRGRGRG